MEELNAHWYMRFFCACKTTKVFYLYVWTTFKADEKL